MGEDIDLSQYEPEITNASQLTTPKVGYVIAKGDKNNDTQFFKTVKDAINAKYSPLGIVVYTGDREGTNLAIALKDAIPNTKWASSDGVLSECGVSVITDETKITNIRNANSGTIDGVKLANGCDKNHEHNAAIAPKTTRLSLPMILSGFYRQ